MILFAPVYWIANGFLDQMAPSFSINYGLQYFKKKGGLQWGSLWTYDLRVYKEKELNATYCCFHFNFEVQSKVTLHTEFYVCSLHFQGWRLTNFFMTLICTYPQTEYSSSWFLFNFTGGFWVTLAVMHVEDCLWRGIIALFVWRYWLLLLFYKIHGLSDVLLHYSIGKHCLWLMCLVWCFLMRGKS